jgi:drug/metabolite transporter (DMT)-like permease
VVRVRRVLALAFGFAGILVVLRPGIDALGPGSAAALGMAAVYAVEMILAKVLLRTESSLTVTFYTSVFTVPVTLVATLFVWRTPLLNELGWLFAIAVCGVLAHLALVQTFKETEMTTVLPFDFTKLVWATIFGHLVFAEIPDVWTWVGGIMISVATTYLAYRETHAKNTSG